MAVPPNIEKFNMYTARIFALLYEKFPVPFDLCIHHIEENWCLADTPDMQLEVNESGVIAVHTVVWLRDSGFIDYTGSKYTTFYNQSILTAKGLEVMNAIPDSLTAGQTLGSFLKDVVSKGVTESAIKGVQFALAKGLEYVPLVIRTVSN